MLEQFLQQLCNGLVMGSGYSLMAVGLTMIFGLMNVVNFAHGEFYMLGGFFAYYLTASVGINFFLSLGIAALMVMGVGLIFEVSALRPLREQGKITTVLLTIGLSIFLQNTALILWSPIPKNMPTPFSPFAINLGPVSITEERIFAIIAAFTMIVCLHLMLQKTKIGKALRATFQNKESAALMGVDINRVYSFTFAIGTGLAAIAGVLLGSIFFVQPTMGKLAVSKAFIVVILGGLGSFPGAIGGGFILGMAESLGAGFISTGYKDAIGFVFVILILMFKPSGLFGRKK